jgi:hypothetical protein
MIQLETFFKEKYIGILVTPKELIDTCDAFRANPTKAQNTYDWEAETLFKNPVKLMVDADILKHQNPNDPLAAIAQAYLACIKNTKSFENNRRWV